jgi:hypothetical protein
MATGFESAIQRLRKPILWAAAHERQPAVEVRMANRAETWEALCMAAAIETDPDRLRNLITELEVRLEAREEELRRMPARTFPKPVSKPSLLH